MSAFVVSINYVKSYDSLLISLNCYKTPENNSGKL